tara:strand:- start:207 stop:974 length:768 start_codon:yes stop_codon:yes gene_type:complete
MDYLNYGKQVQQKPHGFDDKVQLTKDDFSFGDLNEQTTQPQASSQIKDDVVQLFPTPVLICPCPFEYGVELEWIKQQDTRKKNKNSETGQHFNRQSEDTFILDKPELSRVRQFIELKVKEFVVNIMGSDSEMVITQSWLNKSGKGESHHEHKHPNSMISGVWYPQIHEKLPPIQFRIGEQRDVSLSIKTFNHFNSAIFLLPMKKGELILFPSNLQHSVPANQSDEERISLSFNTWAKGNLGNKKNLTYLPFDRLM